MPADWPLYLLPLFGHALLWIHYANHVHATGLPRWAVKSLTGAGQMIAIGGPLRVIYLLGDWHDASRPFVAGTGWALLPWPWQLYLAVTSLLAIAFLPRWLAWRLRQQTPSVLRSQQSTHYDIGGSLGNGAGHRGLGRALLHLPGNEILRLEITDKTLEIPRLPASLAGVSIAHLADLHFTGRIGKPYFQRVVELTNELQPDLIVMTGDLVEARECFSWIDDTLAQLSARLGTYFVLGNHDLRADPHELRRLLVAAGHVDLGGLWQTVETAGQRILLAGNELPWIAPAADLAGSPDAALRILLSHSPDQLDFARRHDYDLLLAGHTHGGQVQLPWLGPIVAPSRFGVKYASGTFYESPTVMHVSRGVSGEVPWRWNCPPEVTKLTLVPASRRPSVDKDRPLAAAVR